MALNRQVKCHNALQMNVGLGGASVVTVKKLLLTKEFLRFECNLFRFTSLDFLVLSRSTHRADATLLWNFIRQSLQHKRRQSFKKSKQIFFHFHFSNPIVMLLSFFSYFHSFFYLLLPISCLSFNPFIFASCAFFSFFFFFFFFYFFSPFSFLRLQYCLAAGPEKSGLPPKVSNKDATDFSVSKSKIRIK